MVRRAVAFDAQGRISDPLFVLVLVLVFGFSLLFNFMTYHGSNSHTMPTLVANLGMIIMIIGVLVIGFGHVRPRDLGISWRNVAIGGAAFPLAWCAFAIAEGTMGFAGANFALNSAWNSRPGIDGSLSDWVGQIFGNAQYDLLAHARSVRRIGFSRSLEFSAADPLLETAPRPSRRSPSSGRVHR